MLNWWYLLCYRIPRQQNGRTYEHNQGTKKETLQKNMMQEQGHGHISVWRQRWGDRILWELEMANWQTTKQRRQCRKGEQSVTHSQTAVVPDTYSYSLYTVLREHVYCVFCIFVRNPPPPTTNFGPFKSAPISAIFGLNNLLKTNILICYSFQLSRTMVSTLCSVGALGFRKHISFLMKHANINWVTFLSQFSLHVGPAWIQS